VSRLLFSCVEVLQCVVAVCCAVLQCVVVCCSVVQRGAFSCSVLQHVAVWRLFSCAQVFSVACVVVSVARKTHPSSTNLHVAVCCGVLQSSEMGIGSRAAGL